MLRKIELKRQFNNQYDDGEGAEGSNHYEEIKKEVSEQVVILFLS